MKLTVKDKEFLERLKALFDSKDLSIEMKEDGFKRLVLRKNYGDKIQESFRMTRQGVRYRFQRVFGDIYASAYETIYTIEKAFGTDLRPMVIEIARERCRERKKAKRLECETMNQDANQNEN